MKVSQLLLESEFRLSCWDWIQIIRTASNGTWIQYS
jgi:hypothetical protein